MIGHTMPAAGAAGLIKAVLAVHHGVLPPTLHCEEPSPALAATRFRTLATAEPWDASLRRAAVNAFGFGGINAHVIVDADDGVAGASRRVQVTGANLEDAPPRKVSCRQSARFAGPRGDPRGGAVEHPARIRRRSSLRTTQQELAAARRPAATVAKVPGDWSFRCDAEASCHCTVRRRRGPRAAGDGIHFSLPTDWLGRRADRLPVPGRRGGGRAARRRHRARVRPRAARGGRRPRVPGRDRDRCQRVRRTSHALKLEPAIAGHSIGEGRACSRRDVRACVRTSSSRRCIRRC
jgi:hypothetical protein